MDRPSYSYRTVFIGLVLTLALGSLAALYVFNRYTTYESTALTRVPEDAEACVRLNLQQALLYDPLVDSLLPLVERGHSGPEPRVKHLERRTTIELEVDPREFVMARLPRGRWLLVVAGFLRHSKVLEGVERMCQDEGIAIRREGELLVHPASGVSFAVAQDGTLLLGSDARTVSEARSRAALPSWAGPLTPAGLAAGVYVAPPVGTSSAPASHLQGGTLLVKGETYFPVTATFRLAGENWTEEQLSQLFTSKSGDFTYVFPLDGLEPGQRAASSLQARTNLGRARFDEAVKNLAREIDRLLPPAPATRN